LCCARVSAFRSLVSGVAMTSQRSGLNSGRGVLGASPGAGSTGDDAYRMTATNTSAPMKQQGLSFAPNFGSLVRVSQQAVRRLQVWERSIGALSRASQQAFKQLRVLDVLSQQLRRPTSSRGRLLFALLPTLAAFWAGSCFVWNHFLNGPYLLDSGWFSAITYREGVFPDNPPCAHPLREYFGLHVTPLVSLGSLLSYLVPLDRVPYYCLFQGLIYAPLGALAALLARAKGGDATWGGACLVLGGAFLFAFNGQVLACLGYPHFEIFLSVGLCLMLVGFAAGRLRLAWLGLILAAATREDGGFHAVAFIVAALACSVSRRPFPIERRDLLRMAGAALLASVGAIVVQRVFFEPANLFRAQYLGNPAFGHITSALLQKRLLLLPDKAAFILLPMLGTAILCGITRDPRYLFGWIVELPWFLINFLAAEELKSAFSVYTGFPFVASIFWVGAYGQVGNYVFGKQRWLAVLSVVSALSTYGLYRSHPNPFKSTIRTAMIPADVPYAELADFSSKLEQNAPGYNRLLVDRSVAAWAVKGISRDRCVGALMRVESPESFDGIAFFRRGGLGAQIPRFIDKSPFSQCGRIPQTEVFLCMRPGKELPVPFEEASLGS
jgi:hypothetical protein